MSEPEPRTLAHVLARLDDRSHTGTLRLSREGHPDITVLVSEGRIIGLCDSTGSPLRRDLGAMLVASGVTTVRKLARFQRRARAKGVTVEWQLTHRGVSADALRRLSTVDVREQLLELMDTGGFYGRLQHGLPSPDPWQDPLAIGWLIKSWRERRAEAERLGPTFPASSMVFQRTALEPTALFAHRGAAANPNSPYVERKTGSTAAPPPLPAAARLVYLCVDGRLTATELGFASALLEHDTKMALLDLQRAGFVQPGRMAAPRRSGGGLVAAVCSAALLAALAALAVARPFAAEPPVATPSCGVLARALGLSYIRDGVYPPDLQALVQRGFLAEHTAESLSTYEATEDGRRYALPPCTPRAFRPLIAPPWSRPS